MALILISIIISLLNAFITFISQFVFLFIKNVPESEELKNEMDDIKKKMSEISIMDEFPKYALLERKLNKLREQMKKDLKDKCIAQLKLKVTITYSLQAAIILSSVVLFWSYRWVPIATLPHEWLYPFSGVMSWPTGQPGAIGFPVWFLACNSFAKLIAKPFV